MIKQYSNLHTQIEKLNNMLNLTVNQNIMSETARKFQNSGIDRHYYFLGSNEENIVDMGFLTFFGIPKLDQFIEESKDILADMLNCRFVNISPLSGLHAITSLITCVSEKNTKVFTINPDFGGHFPSKYFLSNLKLDHAYLPYNYDKNEFDFKLIESKIKDGDIILLDVSNISQPLDVLGFKENIAKDFTLIYDVSHTLGLIVGGNFPNPIDYGADYICGNTHKSFPGPPKGFIAYNSANQNLENNLMSMVSSGHIHHILSFCVSIREMKEFGKLYSQKIIDNSNLLANILDKIGYNVRKLSGDKYSFNQHVHIMIDDSDKFSIYKKFINSNINTNIESMDGKSFVRLGTQEITRRGIDIKSIADLVNRIMSGDIVDNEVTDLIKDHIKIQFSFD